MIEQNINLAARQNFQCFTGIMHVHDTWTTSNNMYLYLQHIMHAEAHTKTHLFNQIIEMLPLSTTQNIYHDVGVS